MAMAFCTLGLHLSRCVDLPCSCMCSAVLGKLQQYIKPCLVHTPCRTHNTAHRTSKQSQPQQTRPHPVGPRRQGGGGGRGHNRCSNKLPTLMACSYSTDLGDGDWMYLAASATGGLDLPSMASRFGICDERGIERERQRQRWTTRQKESERRKLCNPGTRCHENEKI